jgi:hypothetical protein
MSVLQVNLAADLSVSSDNLKRVIILSLCSAHEAYSRLDAVHRVAKAGQ